ncbi:unnamed protein product, partial [marine sediment metagenome]
MDIGIEAPPRKPPVKEPTKTDFDKVNTTETREDFDTGSRRGDRRGKGRFDLIPYDGLLRVAKHYENGAE